MSTMSSVLSNDRAVEPSLPSSSSAGPPASTTTEQSNSAPTLQRKPTITFSQEALGSAHSSMSNRRAASASDEITPIRQADDLVGRNYNTTTSATGPSSSRPPPKPSAASPSSSTASVDQKHETSWLKRIAEKYGSVSLDNKGSVARDHLALERTFLAWLRTSLAFASIGIAITQLFRLNTSLSNRKPRRSSVAVYSDTAVHSNVPLSPYLGHAIPAELLPYLQHVIPQPVSEIEVSELGSTLLDQLLLLSPSGTPVAQDHYTLSEFDEGAAAKLRHVGKPLGATFLGISVVVLLVGFHRYFESQYWIIRGKFPASRGSIALVGIIAGALTIASLVVILVIAPTSYEK